MGRLTIQDIAKVLVTKNGLKQSEANRFVTELFAIIHERLENNDQVKVKGLGTWKVITVDARESVSVRTGGRVMIEEHSKITFTPDVTMKELVNKPFSQFETVVLNDNVEFDDLKEQPADTDSEDIKDDMTEEEPIETQEEPAIAPLIEIPEESIKEESEAIPEDIPEEIPEDIHEEKPEETPEEETEEETDEETEEETDDSAEEPSDSIDFEDDDDKTNNWFKWVWIAFAAVCLIVISAAGGYYYGCKHTALAALSDTVFVKDTIYIPENQDSTITEDVKDNSLQEDAAKAETSKEESPKVEEVKPKEAKAETPKVEKPVAETPKVEKPKTEPSQEIDKYAQKDERVRLGAYRIVGLDHEVKVLQGQTFYSICRAHLGPDMECYIEVYNDLPRNPQIKAGQVIKIPKLQLKKRKK